MPLTCVTRCDASVLTLATHVASASVARGDVAFNAAAGQRERRPGILRLDQQLSSAGIVSRQTIGLRSALNHRDALRY